MTKYKLNYQEDILRKSCGYVRNSFGLQLERFCLGEKKRVLTLLYTSSIHPYLLLIIQKVKYGNIM